MTRYAAFAGGVLVFFATTWLVVEALGVPLLVDPEATMDAGGVEAAAVGFGLLVADAVLPVPSSVVMIALGSLYGAPLGIALSLAGRTAMALLGFGLGRRSDRIMERIRPADREWAEALLERRGALAIVLSRPLPLLAETVTVLAGASPMPWRTAAVAALVGSLPEAVAYGLAGSLAASFPQGAVLWLLFALVAFTVWMIERHARARSALQLEGS
ncbi:MAG TPA: VTT domain-containing protein [Solirubrobacterales bacterium]|nr:VTT domain-containing protein [Solirubrobacterales bacterium]